MPNPRCFDPYLRYAISTDFSNFEFFDENEKFKLFFLVEFKDGVQGKDFADDMNGYNSSFAVELVPADPNTYATMRSNKAAVTGLDQGAVDIWEKYVSRVELSLPLKPSEPSPLKPSQGGEFLTSILIGVIDDGCPFAAAQLLLSGANTTRVRALWDQNQGKEPVPIKDSNGAPCLFGQPVSGFNYGLEFRRESIPAASPKQMGLNEWIQSHETPTGGIDEDGCYADAGFSTLRFRESHGAHVTDVLAGRVPISSRISQNRLDPPKWTAVTDNASLADVVFVQFPENCIRDSTGVWLKAYVVDGIRYIMSFAAKKDVDTVIINISYGPTTGPHNGTAVLEEALTALVAEFAANPDTANLEIALAAGNAYLTEGHVHFIGDKEQPVSVEWTWRLPPDNTALCFAEVWMNNADAADVKVSLTSPSGVIFASTATPPAQSPAGVDVPLAWGSYDTMWRLQVEPTVTGPGVVVEHGDWTIKVAGVRQNAEVHAYVARTDPNMDVFTGAKLSYFVDPSWERTQASEASCAYVDGEFDKTGSLVNRYGTLNGIATGKDQSVHVAGGYMLANNRKSPYSSAGPARAPSPRVGPDFVLPCDESYALQGVLAGGDRSGAVFRLIGTSAAAPQLARWVADGWDELHPPPTDVPTDDVGIEQRGGGNVPPP
jgi:hypothetical protein